jgi:hypothetical protein
MRKYALLRDAKQGELEFAALSKNGVLISDKTTAVKYKQFSDVSYKF